MYYHLLPYKQVFISVTLNLDEATEITDALELMKSLGESKGLADSAEKLQRLLTAGIAKAMDYQQRKGTT